MPCQSTVELTNLEIPVEIGTYAPGDTVPVAHLLDLTLTVDPALVLIDADGMDHVFDYDPLITEILRLARDGPYATQERLMTRIVQACAGHPQIAAAEVFLRKTPVAAGTGALGVRLSVDRADLDALR
ncbi:dihydroneopterin aldolase [Roseovarius sp. D22-M7]|uniref:dihydroneopterin aldolase n=1 Tax=Roseovarius sp. D22-M7 TaxID=3127116 RepID=UPI00300F87EA